MNKTPEGSSKIPSKVDLLMKMWYLQKDSFDLLLSAELFKNKGDLDSARKEYDRLISVSKEQLRTALLHNQHYESPVEIPLIVQPLVNAMFTQADIYQSMGNLQQTEKIRNEALGLSREHLMVSDSADNERARAASLISEGRFNEALMALAASRDLFQIEDDIIKLVRTTIDIVDILQWLGDYNRALSELQRATEIIAPLVSEGAPMQPDIFRRLQDTVALYRISTEIDYYQGLINKALANFEDAEKFFRKVLPTYQNMGVGPAIEYQLASILVEQGKSQEALDYAARLEPAFTGGGFLRPKLAALLNIQAKALLHLNKPNMALGKLQKGITDLTVYYDPDLLWRLQWLQGCALEAMDQKEKALKAYIQAANTVNNLRKAPLGYRLDSTYLSDKLELFETAIDLTYRIGSPEKCCFFMEMIKSRILTTTLSIPRVSQPEIYSELEIQVDEITRQIDALEYTGYREKQTDELRKNRKSLLAKRADLLERIRFSDPRWRNMSEPVPFDLQIITKVLSNQGKAALNLFYKPDKILAVLIKDGKSTVGAVRVSSELNSAMKEYQRNLQTTEPDPILHDLSARFGVKANNLVSSDILSQALQAKGLIIIPHGLLHLIPWAGLIFNGKRLFEYCPIGILPNLSCIPSLNVDFPTGPRVALVGPPDYGEFSKLDELTYAKDEIENIRELYTNRTGIIGAPLIGKEATEEKFWKLARHQDANGGILHIASHGTLDLADPINSGLLLTDSKVDASEIARVPFKYDEVILSACSTGWRPMEVQDIQLVGDDILGLPGAFLEAGARSVLVSIPKAVDIAASYFMAVYHEHRVEGKTPLVALQKCQKYMLSKSMYPIHFWIGFTVYGYQ